jgi:iron complex outermembrane recepter protein
MFRKHRLCAAAAVIAAAAASGAATAQTVAAASPTGSEGPATTASSDTLGEIVVTARKTAENLQKAPVSIAAVSGSELVDMGINGVAALETALPSVSLHTEGPAVVQTFIRGIGTRSDTPNFAAASAIVFNGIVMPRYGTDGLLFDVGTVEEIAGPQGTLYGGSAAGGAININSAQPRNDYSGLGELEGGNYGETHVGAAQNVSINDALSLRGAVDYERHDGYDNGGIDALNRVEGRLSLLAKPTDDLTALVFFNTVLDNGNPIGTLSTQPFFNPSNPWALPTHIGDLPISSSFNTQDNKVSVVGANVEWRVGGNVFTWIPGFVHVDDNYANYSGNVGNLLPVYDLENQDSQELRWNRTVGDVQLSGGLFYLHDVTTFDDYEDKPTLQAPPYYTSTPADLINQVNTSYAIFGQAIYSLTDRLRLTAGARATEDEITAAGTGASGPFQFNRSQTQPDGKLGIDYDLAPRVMVYGNVQTSYIPFGYNPDVKPSTLVPESRLLAFSAGMKSRFLDDTLELNTEVYHYGYRDFQAIAFVSETGLSTVLNAQRSTIYGIDISIRALLPLDTEFNTGVVLQSAHYSEFSGLGYNYSGNQMIEAPAANVDAGLQHRVKLGTFGDLVGRVDTHFSSGFYGNYNNFPNSFQHSYTQTNLLLTYTPPTGPISVQAYVKNLENAAVFNILSPGTTPEAAATGSLAPPRTFGVGLLAHW